MSMFPTDSEIHKATKDALARCEEARKNLMTALRPTYDSGFAEGIEAAAKVVESYGLASPCEQIAADIRALAASN